jgi:hypothetical protein
MLPSPLPWYYGGHSAMESVKVGDALKEKRARVHRDLPHIAVALWVVVYVCGHLL